MEFGIAACSARVLRWPPEPCDGCRTLPFVKTGWEFVMGVRFDRKWPAAEGSIDAPGRALPSVAAYIAPRLNALWEVGSTMVRGGWGGKCLPHRGTNRSTTKRM